MFHRFHDLKTEQDPAMVGGGSRSGVGPEPVDGRALFPSVIRPDLGTHNNQLRVNPQYPTASNPGSGYLGQGTPALMSLGHNIMFPPGKLLSSPSQEAHRYMTEAYRLAAGELEAASLPYGSSGGRLPSDSQSSANDHHKSVVEGLSVPSGSRTHGVNSRSHIGEGPAIPHAAAPPAPPPPAPPPQPPHPSSEREVYNPINLASQISSDTSRMESSNPKSLAEIYNVNRSPPTKVENDSYGKTPYSGSVSSNVPQITSVSPKAKSPPVSSAGPHHLFPGPFTSSYEHYGNASSNFKRQYYEESSGSRRENLAPTSSDVGETSQGSQGVRREGSPPSGEQTAQENIGFSSGCVDDVSLYSREGHSRSLESETGSHLNLDLLTRATTSQIGLLDRSKIMKGGRQLKAYKCDMCDLEFKNGTQLKNHAWRHTGEKPFSCDLCSATFTQQSNLKTHLRIHTGERPYSCEECSATFTQISNLRTHQKIHTGEKPYECDICFTRFSQQSNLKSHKLIHTGERPFGCDECGATFVQSTHLRNHKRIHTDERPYTCDQCGGSFRQLSNLKTHEKIHTGERPHVCEDCGSAFAQKSNLKSHMLKLHATDGAPVRKSRKKKLEAIIPYICEECGAKFTMMSNLKIHMRLHTGEKPYECSVCNASFAQRSNLKSHEQIHTDERPYKCSECPAAFRQKTNLKTHKMKKHPVKSLKIKILSDTQYIMHDIMHDIIHTDENEGEGSSQHIEEPIVQIREGKDGSNLLLGDNEGFVKSEGGDRYEDHGEARFDDHGETRFEQDHGESRFEDHGESRFEDHGESRFEDHGESRFEDHRESRFEDHRERRYEDRGEARYEDHGEALSGGTPFRPDAISAAAATLNPYDSPNF